MKLGLASPWVILYKEIKALFKDDPQVTVVFNQDENEIKLFVDNEAKADALTQLLPATRTYGNIVVKITVVPANKLESSKASLFQTAFEGNPAFAYCRTLSGMFSNDLDYVVFANKVVQFYNDDLGDLNGIKTTLYQDIAEDVFGTQDNVFFCTEMGDDVIRD